jgi:hypothetical protein
MIESKLCSPHCSVNPTPLELPVQNPALPPLYLRWRRGGERKVKGRGAGGATILRRDIWEVFQRLAIC